MRIESFRERTLSAIAPAPPASPETVHQSVKSGERLGILGQVIASDCFVLRASPRRFWPLCLGGPVFGRGPVFELCLDGFLMCAFLEG